MNSGFAMNGLEGISAMLARIEEGELRGAAYTGVQAGLEAICMEARMLCPKDTGALADSIAVRMTVDGGESEKRRLEEAAKEDSTVMMK